MYRSSPARRTQANYKGSEVGHGARFRKFKWGTRNLLQKKPEEANVAVPETALLFERSTAKFTTIGRRRKRKEKAPEPAPIETPEETSWVEPPKAVVEAAPTVQAELASTYASSETSESVQDAPAPAQAPETAQEAPAQQLPALPRPRLEPQRSLHETRYFIVERETGLQYHGAVRNGGASACYASVVPVSKVECKGRGRLRSRRGRVVTPGSGESWIDLQVSGTIVAREVTQAVLAEAGSRVFRTARAAEFHEAPNGPKQYWHARRHRAIARSTIRAPEGAVFLAENVATARDGSSWVMVHRRLWLPVEAADGLVLEEQRVCEGGWFVPVQPADADVESNGSESMSVGYTTPSQMSEGSEHDMMRKAFREPPTKGDCSLAELPMLAIMERGESKIQPSWADVEEWEIGL